MRSSAIKKSWDNLLFILVLVLFYLLVSIPIFHAGFYSDDIFYSLTHGMVELANTNIWAFTEAQNHAWLFSNGRLFPFNLFMQYPFEYFFTAPLPYQITRFAFICISLFPVAWFIKLLTGNIKNSFLFLLILPAFWSLRDMSDPLTSYGIIFPFLLFTTFLSLCFCLKLNSRCPWADFSYLILSICFYILALLTYEIAIAIFPALLILVWVYKTTNKKALALSVLYCLVSLLYLGIYHWFQSHAIGTGYSGVTSTRLGLKTFLTFLYQLSSSLPLSYGIFRGHYFKMTAFVHYFQSDINWLAIILVFFITFFGLKRLLPMIQLNKQQQTCLISLGLIFNLIPSALIGISEKYQTTMPIHLGDGYLPTYIQYVGIAFLAMVLLYHSKKRPLLWASLFSFITCLSVIFNDYMVFQFNERYQQNQRDVLTYALQQNLLQDFPNNAILITNPPDLWNIPAFYLQYGHVRLHTIPLTKYFAPPKNTPLYFIDVQNAPYTNSGYVLYSRASITSTSLTLLNPMLFIKLDKEKDQSALIQILQKGISFLPIQPSVIYTRLIHEQGVYRIPIQNFIDQT